MPDASLQGFEGSLEEGARTDDIHGFAQEQVIHIVDGVLAVHA